MFFISYMTKTVTDTHALTIAIILHGNAKVLNVVAPSEVESGEPFNISYDCKNDSSNNDTLWGHLKEAGTVIDGTYWEELIAGGSTKTGITYSHPGITEPTAFTIEVGHN